MSGLHYELVRPVGRGGMAQVWLARRGGPHGVSSAVALKRPVDGVMDNPTSLRRFVEEARLHMPLGHPNLVRVLDFGELDGRPFIAMEHVDGPSVERLLRASVRARPLPTLAALEIGRQVAEALAYVHGARDIDGQALGIVHRDVSPGNILLAPGGIAKLGDFGVAKSGDSDDLTLPGTVWGSVPYLAPERLRGIAAGPRSDVFSLAAVICEMLTGRRLFGTGTAPAVSARIRDADYLGLRPPAPPLDEDVWALLRNNLAADPAMRQSSADFAAGLQLLVERRGSAAQTRASLRPLLRVAAVPPALGCASQPGLPAVAMSPAAASPAPMGPARDDARTTIRPPRGPRATPSPVAASGASAHSARPVARLGRLARRPASHVAPIGRATAALAVVAGFVAALAFAAELAGATAPGARQAAPVRALPALSLAAPSPPPVPGEVDSGAHASALGPRLHELGAVEIVAGAPIDSAAPGGPPVVSPPLPLAAAEPPLKAAPAAESPHAVAERLMWAGHRARRAGNHRRALHLYRRSVRATHLPGALRQLLRLQLSRGALPARSLRDARALVRGAPRHPESHRLLGDVLSRRGARRPARAAYRRAARLGSRLARARLARLARS